MGLTSWFLSATEKLQGEKAVLDENLKKLLKWRTDARERHLPRDKDKMKVLEDKVIRLLDLIRNSEEIAKCLKTMLGWCIANNEWVDQDKATYVNETLCFLQNERETMNRYMDTLVAEFQSVVSPHDDDAPGAAADDETAAGDHAGGKAAEIATSNPSSGSSSTSRNDLGLCTLNCSFSEF